MSRLGYLRVLRAITIALSWTLLLPTSPDAGASEPSAPPNILLLLADDQQADTIGAWGNQQIQTPHIDQLAQQGLNFRNAYCFGSPHGAVCIPSRAMLHTGRSLFRLNGDLQMKNHPTLGEILGQQGYQTFGTGKWHNGRSSFSKSFQSGTNIMLGGMSDHTRVPVVDWNGHDYSPQRKGEKFSSELFAESASEFLRNRQMEKPFFCYVAFTAPHDPRQPPGEFRQAYDPQQMPVPESFLPQHPFNNGQLTTRDEQLGAWPRTPQQIRQQTAEYYGLIAHLDQQIGKLLDVLEQTGAADNTIIIYAADHGLAMGRHGLLGKQNLYEHSMKAPVIIKAPGIPHGEAHALVYLHDLFPTILELAGIEIPPSTDGRSLNDLLTHPAQPLREEIFLAYGQLMRSLRDNQFKLIQYPQINHTQLFDLQKDPHEVDNLADNPAFTEQRELMFKKLKAAQRHHNDQLPLTVDSPKSPDVNLLSTPRKPDRWQPNWIVQKYFSEFDSHTKALLISGGHWFDVHTKTFQANRGILIGDGEFISLDGDEAVRGRDPATVRRVALADDEFILPGIVDMHAHYNMTLVRRRREEFVATPIIYLANGATVTFSCGEYLPEEMVQLRRRLETGQQIGPRLITSGPYFGLARPGWRQARPTPDEIRQEVDFWAEQGSGGFKAKVIDPVSLQALIDQAHQHDLTVTGHLESGFRNTVNPKDAIRMGIDRIEHFLGGDAMVDTQPAYATLADITPDMPEFQDIVNLFIENGVYFDATISAYGYAGARAEEYDYWVDERQFFTPYVQQLVNNRPSRSSSRFEKIYQTKQSTIDDFWRAGGLITLGTDHNSDGNYLAGFGIHREIDALARSGIPAAEVLKIATWNGARALKLDDEHGSIEVGKAADLYIISGNPLDNIRNTRNGKYVIRGGEFYDAAELLERVKGTIGPRNEEEADNW